MTSSDEENCVQNSDKSLSTSRSYTIRALNDQLRGHWVGGRIGWTSGIEQLGMDAILAIFHVIEAFDAFTPDNDPYGEHDFGAVEVAGERIFWKIDYYDKALELGSPDPADPTVTTRVLTIMLASEY